MYENGSSLNRIARSEQRLVQGKHSLRPEDAYDPNPRNTGPQEHRPQEHRTWRFWDSQIAVKSDSSSKDIRSPDLGKKAITSNFVPKGPILGKIGTGHRGVYIVFWITVSGCPGYFSCPGTGIWVGEYGSGRRFFKFSRLHPCEFTKLKSPLAESSWCRTLDDKTSSQTDSRKKVHDDSSLSSTPLLASCRVRPWWLPGFRCSRRIAQTPRSSLRRSRRG